MFRPLTIDDLEAVFSLSHDVPFSSSWSRELLATELSMAHSLGLFLEQELTAFILYRESGDHCEITWLATSPRFSQQGRMTQLFCQLRNYLLSAAHPPAEIWLELHEGNTPARNLYGKLGFLEVGRRPHYYRDGGAALLLSLKLT